MSTGVTIGVAGGGQLGRMMAYAAHRMQIKLVALDPGGKNSPTAQVSGYAIEGSFNDAVKIRELSKQCNCITAEIEHVNCSELEKLTTEGFEVNPSPQTILMIQDKFKQKEFLKSHGIPLGDFMNTPSLDSVHKVGEHFGYPFMLKSRTGAYDGRGNATIRSEREILDGWQKLGGHDGKQLYAERWVPYTKELAVMVVRGKHGELGTYPVVETIQKNNICHTVLAPAQIPLHHLEKASQVASQAISNIHGRGIFGVELFLLDNGDVYLNEIAPRPHNSGHYTIEACETGQFENHLRAVLGWPLGSCDLQVGCSMMVNILGEDTGEKGLSIARDFIAKSLQIPGTTVHWYGKQGCRKGRKIGHITIVAKTFRQLRERATKLIGEKDASLIQMREKNKASNLGVAFLNAATSAQKDGFELGKEAKAYIQGYLAALEM